MRFPGTRPAWLLLLGVLLLCIAPVAAFSMLQFFLASGVGGATANVLLTAGSIALLLAGVALLVLGAYRSQLGSRRVCVLLTIALGLLALHYFAWKIGVIAQFGGAAALWLLALTPFAVIALVTLVRNAATKKQPLWTGLGFVLWAAQGAAISHLWWMIGGI